MQLRSALTSKDVLGVTLKRGIIYRIKGNRPYENSDGRSHFFIVLNYNPKAGQVLMLTHGTRAVTKALTAASTLGEPASTVVVIPANKYNIFPEQTAIDCNNVEPMAFDELVEIMDNGDLKISHTELDDVDFANVVQGVLDSKRVDDVQKAPLRPPKK